MEEREGSAHESFVAGGTRSGRTVRWTAGRDTNESAERQDEAAPAWQNAADKGGSARCHTSRQPPLRAAMPCRLLPPGRSEHPSGALRLLAQLRVDVWVAPRGEARALHLRCNTGRVGVRKGGRVSSGPTSKQSAGWHWSTTAGTGPRRSRSQPSSINKRPAPCAQPSLCLLLLKRTFRGGGGARLLLQVLAGELKLGALLVGVLALQVAGKDRQGRCGACGCTFKLDPTPNRMGSTTPPPLREEVEPARLPKWQQNICQLLSAHLDDLGVRWQRLEPAWLPRLAASLALLQGAGRRG